MYEAYWGLHTRPFAERATEAFYYPSESHQAALHKLRYALEHGSGGVLVGAAGSGKTLTVTQLCQQLPERFATIVHCAFPLLAPEALVHWLAAELCGESSAAPRGMEQSVRRLEARFRALASEGRAALVAIDEAQALATTGSLETLRLLLHLAGPQSPLVFLLIGQPPLLTALEERRDLEERLALKAVLRPFTPADAAAYIEHRLRAAGATRPLFTSAAIDAVYEATAGHPRRVNRVCDLSLLIGFAEERPQVGEADVEGVCEELLLAR